MFNAIGQREWIAETDQSVMILPMMPIAILIMTRRLTNQSLFAITFRVIMEMDFTLKDLANNAIADALEVLTMKIVALQA